MAKIVQKLFGHSNFPEKVHVLQEAAHFDHRGWARVSEEAALVFDEIDGYEVLGEAAEEGVELAAIDVDPIDPNGEGNEGSEEHNDDENEIIDEDNEDSNEIANENGENDEVKTPLKKLKRAVPKAK